MEGSIERVTEGMMESTRIEGRTRKPFNGLSDAELERLAILAEEAGEIVQCIGKIIRHGYESYHPSRPEQGSNRQHLEEEIGNLTHMVSRMCDNGDISMPAIIAHSREKALTIGKYLHHQ
jgi:NTP pyrophosphatase (non-canonical NTP hydrolase)